MRFVDVAIDLAALLNASRSVAAKHAALRTRQLEQYNKTSSVVASFRRAQDARASNQDGSKEEPVDANKGTESTVTSPAPPIENGQDSSLAGGSSTDSSNNAFSTTLPSFTAGTKSSRPSHILRDLRQQEYATPPTERAAIRSPSAPAESKLHPLDPRYKQQFGLDQSPTLRPRRKEGNVGQDAVEAPDGIDINVFHSRRIANMMGVPSDTGQQDKQRVAKEEVVVEDIPDSLESHTRKSNAVSDNGQTPRDNTVPEGLASRKSSQPEQQSQDAVSGELQTRFDGADGSSTQLDANGVHMKPGDADRGETITRDQVSALGALVEDSQPPTYQLRESKVPASRLSRLWNYGGLAAGMLGGALSESISRGFGGGGHGSVMLSAANMERLVGKLSRMRGAALKLGQMMSFQDSKMLPTPIQEVLQRVQDRADYMPSWQRDRVLTQNLGSEWREIFDKFEDKPIAAASIGQVHRATLKSNGAEVAVKIQFPGVADSINSDLDNLGILLAATKVLPKGLYLNKTIDNARTELAWECDYEREAQCAQRYRELLASENDTFVIPVIYPEASGKQVLTMEYMEGIGVTRVTSFTQEQRDWIGTQILRLCLREITEFKFMQTDPNWTNFLYNADSNKLELLDFGASREYPERFITGYVQLLYAASRSDTEGVRHFSQELGYLTGHESKTMFEAHTQSVLTLAEPFLGSAPEIYDFRDQTITDRVKALIPVMIRERLAPPPEETYSLHRKLSGAFLLCSKLGSQVRCRELFEDSLKNTNFKPVSHTVD